LIKSGDGLLLLSGANTYDGATTVSVGTLRLGNSAALGSTSGLTSVSAGAALDLNGQAVNPEDISALSGSGIAGGGALINSNTLAPASLTSFITLANDSSIGGAGTLNLGGRISGTFALTKVGAGNLRLSGSSAYTGKTSVSGGVLEFSTIGNVGGVG